MNEAVKAKGHWVFVVGHPDGSKTVTEADNLITTAGLQHLAEAVSKAAGNITTYVDTNTDFSGSGLCVLDSGTLVTPALSDDYDDIVTPAGVAKATSAGYPKINDTDGDNSGSGPDKLTWKFAWTAAEEPCASGVQLTAAAVCDVASAAAPLFNRVAATTLIGAGNTFTAYLNVTFA